MLSKSLIASIFLLAWISSASAHAGVNPALGIKGQIVRSDIQRLSDDDADLFQPDDHGDIASLKKQLSNIVPALEIASKDILGPTASANAVACYDISSFVYGDPKKNNQLTHELYSAVE